MPTVHREDGTVLQLAERDFVASGGQGTVYVVGDTAYKLVFDSDRALSRDRRDRLNTLQHGAFVLPRQLLFHADGRAAGHSMPAVTGDAWLALVPTPAWRSRGLDLGAALGLCAALGEAVRAAHQGGAVLGDLNPLNILVRQDLKRLWLIDVDSWGIGPWPAGAVLPTVADPRMQGAPAPEHDWWGVAVNCFQLLTGLHPFRGRHARVKGLEQRAQSGLWALHAEVQCPPATRALHGLDPSWRSWLEAVLTGDHRGPPPSAAGSVTVAALLVRAPLESGELKVALRLRAPEALCGMVPVGAGIVAWTRSTVFWDQRPVGPTPAGLQTVVAVGTRLVGVGLLGGAVQVEELGKGTTADLALQARALGRMGAQVVVLAGDGLYALELLALGARLHVGTRRLGNVHPQASVLHDGVVVSMLAGSSWLALSPRAGALVNLRVPELDGSTVVSAVARGRVVLLLVRRAGRIDRLRLRFGSGWDHHDAMWTEDVGQHALSMARPPGGIVAHTDENGDLIIVPEKLGLSGARRLSTGGRALWGLAAGAGGIVALEETDLVQLSTR